MSHANPKLRFTDTPYETIAKLAAGSLAAETVLNRLISESRWADPTNALGPRGAMHSLDWLDIYGERIVDFYRGVCGGEPVTALAMLRAVEIGVLDGATLVAAIDAPGAPWAELAKTMTAQVKAQIPSFGATPKDAGTKLREFFDSIFGRHDRAKPAADSAAAEQAACYGKCPGKTAATDGAAAQNPDGAAMPPALAALLSEALGIPEKTLAGATLVSMGEFRVSSTNKSAAQ